MDKLQSNIDRALNSQSEFLITELNLNKPSNIPIKIKGGAVCVCVKGDARLIVDTAVYNISKGSEMLFFPDMTILFEECSSNFTLSMFIFSQQIFDHALVKFDPLFFHTIYTTPVHTHRNGEEEATLNYFKILHRIKSDSQNRFRTIIAINLLRSKMLDIYDKISRYTSKGERIIESRKEELYNRFMVLLAENSKNERDVGFYAKKLCITPRYLAEITGAMSGKTPKQEIDLCIIQEIKLMLTFSEMTIQQIADYFHFPDQSYLGRYFKRHTGVSPANYRKKRLAM